MKFMQFYVTKFRLLHYTDKVERTTDQIPGFAIGLYTARLNEDIQATFVISDLVSAY